MSEETKTEVDAPKLKMTVLDDLTQRWTALTYPDSDSGRDSGSDSDSNSDSSEESSHDEAYENLDELAGETIQAVFYGSITAAQAHAMIDGFEIEHTWSTEACENRRQLVDSAEALREFDAVDKDDALELAIVFSKALSSLEIDGVDIVFDDWCDRSGVLIRAFEAGVASGRLTEDRAVRELETLKRASTKSCSAFVGALEETIKTVQSGGVASKKCRVD